MAQQTIDIGSAPNDGTGDPLRDAFDKINQNFTEVYTALANFTDLQGDIDCSGNPNYPSALKGDLYIVSVAGKIGGASGPDVDVGDVVIAKADNAGGTQAAVGASWFILEHNLSGVAMLSGAAFTGDITVPPEAYGAGWNGSNEAPTKNDVYDQIESIVAGIPGSYSDEQARDAIGAALTDTGLVVVTVNDAGDTIDINVPAAVASDINTGTDTTKALTSDALAGSNFGVAVVSLLVSDPNGSAITTGDGKAYYRVPSTLNGMNLVGVAATVTTASSSGNPTIQIANVTDAVDMLSTEVTIDSGETDSSTAATPAVIDGAHDDVATADLLRIDIDTAGTGTKGLMIELQFQLP